MLPSHGGDPEIVVRDGFADLSEFGFDFTIMLRGVMIGEQDYAVGEKVVDVAQLLLSPLRPSCSEVKFAQSHPGQMQNRRPGKARAQVAFAAKVCHDNGGVDKDTTSRAH